MGNAVSAAFTIGDQVGSGGPGNLWKIRSATRKSNGQSVSVFIYEKNFIETLNPLSSKPPNAKKELDKAHEVLKKEAQTLSRLRHPCMLEVTEALDDSKTVLAFGSEMVLCCLSNVLGNFFNTGNLDKAEFRAKYDLDELEIQKGVLQVIKGTSDPFLPMGDWKISGFNFSYQLTQATDTASFYITDYPPFCSPSMDYLAPEVILEERYTMQSDLWSLGCLIYAVFSSGTPPLVANNNSYTYKQKISHMELIDFDRPNIPLRLRDSLRALLVRDPYARLSLDMFQKSEFFDNILISTIGFLETLVEKTQVQKAQFLKGLVKMLPQFSEKLLMRKILPILIQELKDGVMTPFVLPNIFWISDQISDAEFNAKILPALKPVFKMTDPPQAVLLLLSRIDILMKKTSSPETFKQDVMPLIYGALEIPVIQVQEQAVKMVPTLVSKLDFTTVKSVLFPKLQAIYTSSSSLSVRVGALIAIHSTIKLLDKFTLTEKIIPLLKGNKVREPSILVGLLAVYAELARQLDKEIIATEILPELWKLSIDQVLNVTQFKKFMKVIHELTAKVEEQHVKVLQEMKTMAVSDEKTLAADSSTDFASLVRGGVNAASAPSSPMHSTNGSPSKSSFNSDPPPVQAAAWSKPTSPTYTIPSKDAAQSLSYQSKSEPSYTPQPLPMQPTSIRPTPTLSAPANNPRPSYANGSTMSFPVMQPSSSSSGITSSYGGGGFQANFANPMNPTPVGSLQPSLNQIGWGVSGSGQPGFGGTPSIMGFGGTPTMQMGSSGASASLHGGRIAGATATFANGINGAGGSMGLMLPMQPTGSQLQSNSSNVSQRKKAAGLSDFDPL
ncbi:hypothetical protein HDU67_000904 [Dinochytrium kinnereticum]|nr:hypothetical protein HDU67_000904 [Dinochytrium kinnereticum]